MQYWEAVGLFYKRKAVWHLSGNDLFVHCAAVILYFFIFTTYFVHSREEPFFSLAFLSIISGLGNSLIVFVINEALNRTGEFRNVLQIYFLIGLLTFIASAMIARRKLIIFTNDLVYNKRMELINNILRTSFQKFETVGNDCSQFNHI